MKTLFRLISLGAAALALTACVVAPQPVYQTSRYPYQPAQPIQQGPYVQYGRIANIEVLRNQTAGMATAGGGALVGGLVGGLLGNQIGGGSGRGAATMAGVLGGILLGNAIEGQNNAPRVYESYRISIQTDNGGYRVFDVPSPGDLRVGDRVRLDNGQISRY